MDINKIHDYIDKNKSAYYAKKLEEQRLELQRIESRKLLNQEIEYGHPDFKEDIAKILIDTYNLNKDEAKNLVFEKYSQLIERDNEWSQHMGIEYWAEVINERR